ncbi:phosphotransferase [Terasakiella sp. SH-1]|uniref:phosphotransferase family protein n=1 Tax=Terasakiella sp. SH-1 TaxID=2560057 RepID=UPI001073E761|nr:phosphotransferase [Terasakiella sp. SH-1]
MRVDPKVSRKQKIEYVISVIIMEIRRHTETSVMPKIISTRGRGVVHLYPFDLVAKISFLDEFCDLGAIYNENAIFNKLYKTVSSFPQLKPIQIDECLVTFSKFIHGRTATEDDHYIISASLKCMHRSLNEIKFEKLNYFYFEVEQLIQLIKQFHPEKLPSLREQLKQLCERIICETERHIICHGDTNLGNLLISKNKGNWIDFECVCKAPIEWDLCILIIHGLPVLV